MLRPGSSSSSDLSDLVTEYSLMRDLDHPNVIKLLGACTDSRYCTQDVDHDPKMNYAGVHFT